MLNFQKKNGHQRTRRWGQQCRHWAEGWGFSRCASPGRSSWTRQRPGQSACVNLNKISGLFQNLCWDSWEVDVWRCSLARPEPGGQHPHGHVHLGRGLNIHFKCFYQDNVPRSSWWRCCWGAPWTPRSPCSTGSCPALHWSRWDKLTPRRIQAKRLPNQAKFWPAVNLWDLEHPLQLGGELAAALRLQFAENQRLKTMSPRLFFYLIIIFSLSSEADFWLSNLLARCLL